MQKNNIPIINLNLLSDTNYNTLMLVIRPDQIKIAEYNKETSNGLKRLIIYLTIFFFKQILRTKRKVKNTCTYSKVKR